MIEKYKSKQNRAQLFTIILLAFLITSVSCKQSTEKSANGNNSNANSPATADGTSSTPPFPTKEPQRYQATMITSGRVGAEGSNIPGLDALTNQKMPIARDGEKSRVEMEMIPGFKIIYLQLPTGRYALYPAKKIYAEIKMDGSDNPLNSTKGMPSDFSPDKLINGAPAGAKYEKLGTEEVNGRMTTKYRVTTNGSDSSKTSTEMLIWADESLGMPIKFESTSKVGSKWTMEMRDIKLDVDPAIFELPKDYRKVDHSELLSNALPSVNDILGIDGEKKATKKR